MGRRAEGAVAEWDAGFRIPIRNRGHVPVPLVYSQEVKDAYSHLRGGWECVFCMGPLPVGSMNMVCPECRG